ncbi:hypothetical protein BKA59DRAFT_463163 [Fusarium tricinctum]|jgi:hypothetical protein|uniref:DNA/RNA-binding protein Alba-like domain-containing protein n=2 Tax=Fusarium tricinctum species complex TaxID=679429 RepID=A0A8K0WIF7_9HYPO|nr:hypothetical protein BKA59DRAFT_463163 [Fusarium tricinctum]
MPVTDPKHSFGKRKPSETLPKDVQPQKRSRSDDNKTPTPALVAPHEPIIAELKPKYDILPASVISSTQIKKRITHITSHLLAQGDRPRVALLYARTADVCKLITVVEKCKRVLSEEGKAYHQYNQLFDQLDRPKKKDIIEETILERGVEEDNDSDSDDFEIMHSRFEDAVLPRPSSRSVKSMRIFISITPIQELKSRDGVTVQSGAANQA